MMDSIQLRRGVVHVEQNRRSRRGGSSAEIWQICHGHKTMGVVMIVLKIREGDSRMCY